MKASRHKYEYKVSPHSAAAKVVALVGAGQRVLELGPGPGAVTRLLKENGCRVTALEQDPAAIALVRPYCEDVHACDLNDANWAACLPANTKFDAIVAADVLEHLYDPWSILQSLHTLLEPEGSLVISLPHIAHSAVLASLLTEEFTYQPWGLLDRTHIRFFGLRNIQSLFNDADFKIVAADFVVKAPEQTEFAKHWRKLPLSTQQALAVNPFSNVYQVIIQAQTYATTTGSLRLDELTVPSPAVDSYSVLARTNPLVGFVLSLLSLRNRERIARLVERAGIRL